MKEPMLNPRKPLPTTKTTKPEPGRWAADPRSEQNDQLSQVLNWDGIGAAITFSVPFVVAAAINLQTSVVMTAVLAVILLPVSLLAFCLREKLNLPPWINAPACALTASGITAFAAVLIRQYLPQVNDALGMYLYLLAAYPVVSAVFYGKRPDKASTTATWALRNTFYFGIITCFAGIVRELLAYNTLLGVELPLNFRMEGAKAPFFGFLVFGFVLAGIAALRVAMLGRAAPPDPGEDEEYSGIGLQGNQPVKENTP